VNMKWKSSIIVIMKPISEREPMAINRDSRNVQSMKHEVALMWHHFPAKSRRSQLVKNAPPNLRIQHSSLGPKAWGEPTRTLVPC
jgi:hypothetical protein